MAGILFEDIFDVKDIDPEGKKFDRGELGPGPLLPVPRRPVPPARAPPRVGSPRSAPAAPPLPQGFPSPAAVPSAPPRAPCLALLAPLCSSRCPCTPPSAAGRWHPSRTHPKTAPVPAGGGKATLFPPSPRKSSLSWFLTVLLSPVSRLHCESESFKMDLILDVNIQIYPVDLGKTSRCWHRASQPLSAWVGEGGEDGARNCCDQGMSCLRLPCAPLLSPGNRRFRALAVY